MSAQEVESRISNLQKGAADTVKKSTFATCTGTLELTIKALEGLTQANSKVLNLNINF